MVFFWCSWCLGGAYEAWRRLLRMEVGYNSIKNFKIRSQQKRFNCKGRLPEKFVIVRICLLKGVGIDLTIHRRLLHGMYSIIYRYCFVSYPTVFCLQGLRSRIIRHQLVVCQWRFLKRINTTNRKPDILFAIDRIVICKYAVEYITMSYIHGLVFHIPLKLSSV